MLYQKLILIPLSIIILFLRLINAEEHSTTISDSRWLDVGSFTGNRIHDDLENSGMIVSHRPTGHSGMEWPAGENKYSNFASGVWFAGKVNDLIHTAVAEYAPEFSSGPWGADPNGEDKLFIVNRSDLANPFANDDFQNWPTNLGAPWVDNDGDGIYNPMPIGTDHPEFIGDQVIWYVMNDGVSSGHTVFGTEPLGIEVRVTIWGYNRTNAFGDMIFVKAQAYNKGGNEITDMYIGLWDDPDLGDAGDDFVGCDTTLSLGYCYNDGADGDYGSAPPALGYDFFQAAVPGASTDTTYAFGKNIAGMKKLEMSSFIKYINGDTVYTDPNDAIEAYNYMSGHLKDGTPIINSETGEVTKFVHPDDPNDNTGLGDGVWVDSDDHSSGDRRFLMNVGPLNFSSGDSLELVFGIMHAQGDNELHSITKLKEIDEIAQLAFDNHFATPSLPPAPTVEATALSGEVVLMWDDAAESYIAEDAINILPVAVDWDTIWTTDIIAEIISDTTIIDMDTTITVDTSYTWNQVVDSIIVTYENEPTSYFFEGYNVWQLEFPDGSGEKRRIATFDLFNGVTEIEDDIFSPNYGEWINITVQFGSDSGIQRFIRISYDQINYNPLINDNEYYFAVTAYGYNQYGFPKTLESVLDPVSITPVGTNGGIDYSNAGLDSTVVHLAGDSDGYVVVNVVNPSQVTGNDYEVTFESIDSLLVWDLVDITTSTILLDNQPNPAMGFDNPIVDGLLIQVYDAPHHTLKQYDFMGGDNSPLYPDFPPDGIWLNESYIGTFHSWWGGQSSIGGSVYPNVELRFVPMLSFEDTNQDGIYSNLEPYTWDMYDPNASYADMYRTWGAEWTGFNAVPFSAWNIDTEPPTQLHIVMRDLDNNYQWDGVRSGNYNYIWITDVTYDGTSKFDDGDDANDFMYQLIMMGADMPVYYVADLNIDPVYMLATEATINYVPFRPNDTSDIFQFSTNAPTITIELGDVNNDGYLNILDVVLIVGVIVGNSEFTSIQMATADFNQDGTLDILDVIQLVNYIMEYSDEFLSRSESIEALEIGLSSTYIHINAEGGIGGVQINTEGDYTITEAILPEGWEHYSGPSGVVLLNMTGKSSRSEVQLGYTGDLKIIDHLVSDLFGNMVSSSISAIPDEFLLKNAYPNPFNPITTLEFGIPVDGDISIEVYDLQGRLVETLRNQHMEAGYHSAIWNADYHSSGIYFVMLVAGEYRKTQKLMLVK